MKNKRYYFAVVLLTAFIFASCSSSRKKTGVQGSDTTGVTNKDTAYVYNEVSPAASAKPGKNVEPKYNGSKFNLGMTYYVVQIGAFTTKEKAERFAADSKEKIQDKINVSFNPSINLYVVQLNTHYNSHQKAENERNQLWKMSEFKDAWIVAKQK